MGPSYSWTVKLSISMDKFDDNKKMCFQKKLIFFFQNYIHIVQINCGLNLIGVSCSVIQKKIERERKRENLPQ